MAQGVVQKVYADKGYGFIRGDHGYWFFHQSVLQDTTIQSLKIGQPVEYEEGCGPSGPRADAIRLV